MPQEGPFRPGELVPYTAAYRVVRKGELIWSSVIRLGAGQSFPAGGNWLYWLVAPISGDETD